MVKYSTSDVFGVSNDQVKTYIERPKVDNLFKDGLTQNKHIVIFGASKQGKTALTNRHLNSTEFIKFNCSTNSECIDIYRSLLRQADIIFEETRTETKSVNGEVGIALKANLKIPFVGGIAAEVDPGGSTSKEQSTTYRTEYNIALAQDVSELFKNAKFNKRIILENFHYLDEAVQKQLATDLRVFEDYNILFIILGIWRERNRLTQFNGDLLDRIIEIPVEPWEKDDLLKIIKKGEAFLNVSFSTIHEDLVDLCFDSVGVFQELCKDTCHAAEVFNTSDKRINLIKANLKDAKNKKLNDYSGRHIRSLEVFVEQEVKSGERIPLYIPYYFIKVLFTQPFDNIYHGIKRRDLQDRIKEIHHRKDDVRSSDMGNFLSKLISIQISKGISPPIFDYDTSAATIKIIDSTFYFFLRNCNHVDIMEEIPEPRGLAMATNKPTAIQGTLFPL